MILCMLIQKLWAPSMVELMFDHNQVLFLRLWSEVSMQACIRQTHTIALAMVRRY